MRAHRYLFPASILALVSLFPTKPLTADAPSADRVHVTPGNAEAIDIKTQLSTLAEMASARDLEGYLECFSLALARSSARTPP
jgi:hypothetical protein